MKVLNFIYKIFTSKRGSYPYFIPLPEKESIVRPQSLSIQRIKKLSQSDRKTI